MSAGCPACEDRLDHCHGTLVLHLGGAVECTDQGCTEHVVERHELTISCSEVSDHCPCSG